MLQVYKQKIEQLKLMTQLKRYSKNIWQMELDSKLQKKLLKVNGARILKLIAYSLGWKAAQKAYSNGEIQKIANIQALNNSMETFL